VTVGPVTRTVGIGPSWLKVLAIQRTCILISTGNKLPHTGPRSMRNCGLSVGLVIERSLV